jgi:hypothetical protein
VSRDQDFVLSKFVALAPLPEHDVGVVANAVDNRCIKIAMPYTSTTRTSIDQWFSIRKGCVPA